MSGWASFRRTWIKPEVYPLIGAMGVAVGAAGYILIGKAVKDDAYTTWNKAKRSGKVDLLEVVEEVVPLMSSAKTGSARIFEHSNEIRANKVDFSESEPLKFVRRIGEEEEEEAEEEEAPAVEEVEQAAVETAVATSARLVDEAEDTINAAIDAAIAVTSARADTQAAAPASVVETETSKDSA